MTISGAFIKEIIQEVLSQHSLEDPRVRSAVLNTIEDLDRGAVRVCEENADGQWITHAWVKQAILLYFQMTPTALMTPAEGPFFDKAPLKCSGWSSEDFRTAQFRCVPGSVIRKGAHIRPGVVVMPSFINIGAYIGENTMVDGGVRVGSCAQIGKDCHLGGGVGIGGVLEPLNDTPVIIEDGCFIGAMSHVSEGIVLEEGSVLGVGVTLSATTKIVDRRTGTITTGRIPAYSVVVPGSLATDSPAPGLSLNCAVIVKTVDKRTREKTALNDLLRG